MNQPPVLRFYPVEKVRRERAWVTEFLAHVGKVHAGNQADFSPAARDRLSERSEESGDARILLRWSFAHHHVMERRHKNGDNGELAFPAKDILEEEGLELERVFGAVENFIGEEVAAVGLLQRPHEFPVGFDGTQGRVVIFLGSDEELAHAIVRGTKQDEEVSVAPLYQLLIRPGIAEAADPQIDVWRNDTPHWRVSLPIGRG